MSNSSFISYTKLSPSKNSPRNHIIDTITIHCVAGNCTVETIGDIFAASGGSSNYGIGTDGRIALYVDEKDRSWCTSSAANDHRAVTIEVANDGGAETGWHVSDAALKSLINLVTDICKRNGIKKLLWKSDKNLVGNIEQQNMTVHRWFAAKACPGDYLYGKHGYIADEVNKLLGTKQPVDTPILGKSEMAISTLAQFLLSYNPTPKLTSVNAMQLAELYINEGAIEGVRGDIAFCQSLIETDWFNYGKDVKWEQNNYSGIGATGNGNAGNSFKTPQEGVRAQIQHLKAYSSAEALKQPCVDPRYSLVQKGCAKTWNELSGRWASDKSYGEKILARYALLKAFVPSTAAPAPSAKTVTEIAREVIKGLWGNGTERTTRLAEAGYNPTEIQTTVNSILNGSASSSAEFKPYLIWITAPALNVRDEPSSGTNSKIVKCLINDKNTYTIIAEAEGQGATKWGKLKSGLGWISLDYTKKV